MELKRDNFFVELYILYFDSYPNNLCQFVQKLFWVTLSLLTMPLLLLVIIGYISYNKIKSKYWYENLNDFFRVFYYFGLICTISVILFIIARIIPPNTINLSELINSMYLIWTLEVILPIILFILMYIVIYIALFIDKFIISKINSNHILNSKKDLKNKPSFWKTIFLYLKAKKEKICPLIKIT